MQLGGTHTRHAPHDVGVQCVRKLQYIAQLQGVPPHWLQLEKWAIQTLFPGPKDWLPAGVAQQLRDEFKMPYQLQSLTTSGPAAQLRVAIAGGDYRRRPRLEQLNARVEQAHRTTTAWDVEWRWCCSTCL